MSELTSSTEVDGASSVLTIATCNTHVEDTPRPETTVPEQTEDNPDSLTRDYVIVGIPINADSDELRSETNQRPIFTGYLEQYAEYLPSLQSLASVLPAWLFSTSENVDAASANPDTSVEFPAVQSFETWVQETINGDYTSSVEDEQRFRSCLVRAMSENLHRLHSVENTFFTESYPVSTEEMCYAQSSEAQCTRRLLLMLLRRDVRTMLSFVHRMLARDSDTVDSILTSLDRHLNDSSSTHQTQCLRCVLRERVNISLVTDHLSRDLFTFVNTMSEEDQPGQPSNSERLWDQLFEIINNSSLYQSVIRTIASAIESCGYHTDILRMMQDTANIDRNSFVCTCETVTSDQSGQSHNSDADDKTQPQSVDNACGGTQTGMPTIGDTVSSNNSYNDNESENGKDEIGKGVNTDDRCKEDLQQSRNEESDEFHRAKYKRKPDNQALGNIEKKRNKEGPDLSKYQKIVYTNINSSKRKEGPSRAAIEERKRRKEEEYRNRRSSIGNCDLQIELMKIAGRENSHGSGSSLLSIPSTTSYVDSGFHEQSHILFRGSQDDEETVPKQIVSISDHNPKSETSDAKAESQSKVAQEDEESQCDTYVPLDLSGLEHGEVSSDPDSLNENNQDS